LNYNVSVKPYALNNGNPSTGLLPSAIDSLTYTSFESVNTISESPYSASFIYNPDEERAKMEVSQSGSVILSRWYTSSGYIKEISAGVTKEYTFIGGDAYTAPVLAIKQNGSAPTWYYLLRDHLGSITHVVNASNNTTLYEYNYDAWGRMRDPTNWEPYAPSQIAQSNPFVAGRGFTGHEHLPWFNMINMNGRLYDPLTGQFLSPDNNVQLPDFTQNLNRYVYALNNPLKYTDPDGEWVITALTMLANMYVSTSAANGWQFNPVKWDWRNVKTWSSLVQSGRSGYYMGSSAENFIKEKSFDFRMNRAINDKSIQTNPDGSLIMSDETLYDFSRQYFKRFKYRNNIPLRYDNSINTDGITYGVTLWDPVGLKPVCSFSDIAFSSKKALFLTMGHEYIHATHYLLRFPSSSLGDYAAFSWEALVSSKAGDMKWAGDATLLAGNNIHWYNRIFNSQYKWKVWEYTPDLGIPLIMPDF
jgi:RHS repeat-associated protein